MTKKFQEPMTNSDGSKRLGLTSKDSNPKDGVGVKKWRQFCCVPFTVVWELGVAMLEGAMKYGRHNYRVSGVRASIYVEAARGHIDCYWEGEDTDPDSGLPHIVKAMASLAVLRDAQIQGRYVDDRPPKTDITEISERLQGIVDELFEKYPDPIPPYVEGDQYTDEERAWKLYCQETAGDMDVKDFWSELTPKIQKLYLEKVT